MAQAEQAKQAGSALDLGSGHRAEPSRGGWVIVDETGYALVEVENSAWSPADDPGVPALRFGDPAEAFSAFVRSQSLAGARAERREAALRRLGRE